MITITKQNDGVLFTFENSDKYLYGNGTIEVPFNTLSIVADESDMITLKKAASNDVFISARYDTDFGYRSKDDAIDDLKDLLFAETGGGSESGITSGEVQTMINNSLEDYYTDDEVDAALSGKASVSDVTAVANDVSTLSGQVATKVAINDFNAYSAATDSRLAEDEEVTAAALNNLQENKVDTSAVTQEISAAISGKADTSAVTAAIDDAKAYYISFATLATVGIHDEDWNGIVAAIDDHRPIYAGYPRTDGGIIYYGVECMNKNSDNTQIVMTASDDNQHYFYTFVKNGSNDYSYTVDTRPYTTNQEKTEWSAKQDALSAGTGIEISGNVISATGGGGSYVYYTEDTSSESATIKVQNDDGLGNRSENRVFVDGGDIIIESYNETDDGEGNTGTTDTQVDINSLGLSIIASSDDGIDTTQTELEVQPMGAYINSEPIATEPYVDAAITGKVDTSAITTSITSGSTDSEIPTAKAVYDAIPTGGGATYSAGTNISIDTANTINCTLNLRNGTGTNSLTGVITEGKNTEAKGKYNFAVGENSTAGTSTSDAYAFAFGYSAKARKGRSFAFGGTVDVKEIDSAAFGQQITLNAPRSFSTGYHNTTNNWTNIALGEELTTNNRPEFATGTYNNSVTGSTASGQTLFSVGNGTSSARHNAFEVRQNGDIYVNDGTNDVRLQDTILALGGLKLVKLTQNEYDQLATKDPDTLYIISNVVS